MLSPSILVGIIGRGYPLVRSIILLATREAHYSEPHSPFGLITLSINRPKLSQFERKK